MPYAQPPDPVVFPQGGLVLASKKKIYIVDELEFGFLGGIIYELDVADLLPAIEAHGSNHQ